jgi:oligopeptidase A
MGDVNPLQPLARRPRLGEVEAAHVAPGIRAAIAASVAALAPIRSGAAGTWDTTVGAYDGAVEAVREVTDAVEILLHLRSSPELRAAFDEVESELRSWQNALAADADVFRAVEAFAGSPAAAELSPLQRRRMNRLLQQLRLAGAGLDEGARARLLEVRTEIDTLGRRFNDHITDTVDAFHHAVPSAADLRGLPLPMIENARARAEASGEDGFVLGLDDATTAAVLEYCENREVRRVLYQASITRGTAGGRDNRPLLRRILELRREEAALLGRQSYAEAVLEPRMAGTPRRVAEFLEDLRRRLDELKPAEAALLEEEARQGGIDDVAPWDLAFLRRKVVERMAAFDENAVRPYFALPGVLSGLFDIVHGVFGLSFEEEPAPEAWHPTVRYFTARDAAGRERGGLYLDLFPREGKRGGAFASALRTAGTGVEGSHLVAIAANVTPPGPHSPALLSVNDVSTLYHEMGHALHVLLSEVELPAIGGYNVAWDFVELPSQLLENLLFEEAALTRWARHHETGEPMPATLIERMRNARFAMSALRYLRQVGFASVDYALHHEFRPDRDGDPVQWARSILGRHTLRPEFAENDFIATFRHIFSGGYAAGYYSYLWSEALEADAFRRFTEVDPLSADVGRAFVDAVLARGDSEDPDVLFRRFMGRDSRGDALLERIAQATGNRSNGD